MNILYLSPHFPPNFYLFPSKLVQRGGRVLGITDQHISQLRPDLQMSLWDHKQVSSLHSDDEVMQAVEKLVQANGPIHRVESHLETWLNLEAKIRRTHQIFGLKEELDNLTKKSRMKEYYLKAKVATAPFKLLSDYNSALEFVAEVGYPIIIKPDTGIGAQDTHKIENLNQLQAFLETRQSYPYIMENFISGDIVTFDGLTDSRGNIVFSTCHEYSKDARRIASESLDFYYYNYRETPEDLARAGQACVEVLELREKFFHLEFFRTSDHQLVGIELNIRPPGGMTTDMMNYAHDMDVYDLWASIVLDQYNGFELQRKYHCAHISRRRRYNYKYTHEQILEILGEHLCLHSELPPIYAEVMGEWAYLVRYEELGQLQEAAQIIHQSAE